MQQLFHVLNRGVDKRKLFMDDKDFYRFIHDLFEFNDQQKVADNNYYFNIRDIRYPEIKNKERRPRKLLVDLLAFCLMPNHYHLLLRPRIDGAMSLFMRKIDGGYSRYFNQRHERTGTLFERRYKSVLINDQAHFIHMPYYIHLNPLDTVASEWRERKINNLSKALNYLDNYKWSSHLDYMGKDNFSSVTQRDFLFELFGGSKGYEKKLKDWLKDLSINKVMGLMLE